MESVIPLPTRQKPATVLRSEREYRSRSIYKLLDQNLSTVSEGKHVKFLTGNWAIGAYRIGSIQVRSKDSQVKTQLVLWIFILFKVTK